MSGTPDSRNVILLETINPSDFTLKDLWEIADDLNAAVPQFSFVPAYEEQHGAGVTWHEVIRIWVENEDVFKGAAFEVVLAQIIEVMRRRFGRKHGGRRPKSIMVNDKSTGKEVRSIVINLPAADPVDVEISIRIRPVPPEQSRPND
jgi:hypothetical protein